MWFIHSDQNFTTCTKILFLIAYNSQFFQLLEGLHSYQHQELLHHHICILPFRFLPTLSQARSQGGFGRFGRTALLGKRSTISVKRSTIPSPYKSIANWNRFLKVHVLNPQIAKADNNRLWFYIIHVI